MQLTHYRKPEFCILSGVLRILYVAYPLLTVTGESAGGAEQVLWTLERELARRGDVHTLVAASAGSLVAGELFPTGDPCIQPDDFERRNREHQDKVINLIRQRAGAGQAFDLVHDMSGSLWRRAGEVDVPVLATLHLPRSFYSPQVFHNIPANVRFNCVSHAQAVSFSDLDSMIGIVPNGIALDRFAPDGHSNGTRRAFKREHLLWLGRVCEEKAPHLALAIARCAGLPITLAGQVYPFSYHQQYFEREVVPRLREMPHASFIASPPFKQKCKLLKEARALLITSQVDETSSLVAMEAAASGTPVIAFRRGALPEVVRDGVTGFLVDDFDGAVTACRSITAIDPAACILHASKSFGSAAMAAAYLQLYETVVQARGILRAGEA